MAVKMSFETFDSFADLMVQLESRPEQKLMNGKKSSHNRGESDWNGTSNYEEAVEIMKNGYPEAVEKIKKKESKLLKVRGVQVRNKQKNDVVGHTPIVPNLLQGIPINKIHTERKVQKAKTVHIVWDMGENCGVSRKEIEDNSLIVLEAITRLEQNGIRVMLDTCLYCGEANGECLGASVTVKGYREKLDITRVSGMMAHVSLFRRIGFRWLETCPTMTSTDFAWGYGRSIHETDHSFIKHIEEKIFRDGVFITMDVVRHTGKDVDRLVKYVEDKLKDKVTNR
jgi:hypothetical protein